MYVNMLKILVKVLSSVRYKLFLKSLLIYYIVHYNHLTFYLSV